MKDYFVFGNINTQDYQMFIANKNQFEGGGKVVEVIKIPGRNGTLSIEDGSFENVPISYSMYCKYDMLKNVRAFRNALAATSGYCKLSDTYEPDIYMRARYVEKFKVDTSDHKGAALTVSFDCDPRRFIMDGDKKRELTSSISIKNPTRFDAFPLLRVYGTGTVTIGGIAIRINTANEYTDIDCEIQEAYKGLVNCNNNITLTAGKFPILKPGINNISLSGVSKVEITPHWYNI